MASDDSEDDDHKSLKEEMLTCQLCFEVYNTPKLLSCQHSFCEHCLERWVETNHGRLVCPCCRQDVSLPVGGVKGLPTNRVISHFFDYIDRSKRKAAETQGVPCETCSSKNADRRCIDCSQYLCGRCSTVHSKGKLTRKHRIMTIEDFETEKLTNPTIEQPETYCEKHSDAAFDVFCQTCETCVCVKCALTEHPNPTHQYVSVDKAAVQAKEDFREFVQELDQDRKRTSDARNAVENELLKLEENLKAGMEKIDKHVDEIIQKAREMQKKTQESYRKAFDRKTKVLKSQIENLEGREKSLSNTREFAEMQISYASSAQFLLLKDEMKQQIQNILTTYVNTDLEENSCLDFEVDASPAVDEFGEVQTSSAVGHMSELDGLNTEIFQVGEEHTFNIWTKDSKGRDVAAAPYVKAVLNIDIDDLGEDISILPVENSTWNASLCHVKVNFWTEGNYQLAVSVCGQPLSGTPIFMRVYSAGGGSESYQLDQHQPSGMSTQRPVSPQSAHSKPEYSTSPATQVKSKATFKFAPRSDSAAAGGPEGGHYQRISYQQYQIPPRQHSSPPNGLSKGQQQPQLAHTPPQTVTATPLQQAGAGVVLGGQPSMMPPHYYQQHRPSQPYYHHQPLQHHLPSGINMQRPVAPQSQQMYSTSPATQYQPGVPQSYSQHAAQQAPCPNCGLYHQPTQQPQPMAPPVQYRLQQQTYSAQPVRTYKKAPPSEKKLIRIIDPNKGVDVTDEIMKSSSNSSVTTSSTANITPPLSGRSSASGTPPQISQSATLPPSQQQIQGNSIAAQFAAQVAATLDGPGISNIDDSSGSDRESDW